MNKRWPDDYADMIRADEFEAGDVIIPRPYLKETATVDRVTTKWNHPGLSAILTLGGREFSVAPDSKFYRLHTKMRGVIHLESMSGSNS